MTQETQTFNHPSIEQTEYAVFVAKFKAGEFGNQRLGQAFFNHFQLHKMKSDTHLNGLYQKDGDDARIEIHRLFNIH